MADKSKMFMETAIRTAEESNCVKYKVGAVLVRDNRIVLQGYNGTPPCFINCSEKFKDHDMNNLEHRKIHSEWSKALEVHAEMNIIAYAAKEGIPIKGTTLFITHKPCNYCTLHLYSSGVHKVIFLNDYEDNNIQEDMEILKSKMEFIKFKL